MEQLKIRSVTWNVAALDKPVNFSFEELLGSQESMRQQAYDMYIIGFQEVSARVDKYLFDTIMNGDDPWTLAVIDTLKPHGYIKIRSIRLLGIVLSVFCLTKHITYLRNIETQYTRLGYGYIGLKGAVSVRFELYGTSYCFVCCHLSAHDHMLDSRIQEYNAIIENHTYKSEMTQNILYHDYIIWMGDLNFRMMEETFSHEEIVQAIKAKNLKQLQDKDQLNHVKNENSAFHELSESLIDFAPTFKHVIGSDDYDIKRRPAWTDRILYRVNTYNLEDLGIRLSMHDTNYTSHTDKKYRCSDHRPVSSNIVVDVIGEELAKNKDIEGWKPTIKFFPTKKDNVPQDWFVNQDGKISYEFDPSSFGSRIFHPWDWIGLYHEDFTSLEDYATFTWASACRRPRELKFATIQDAALYAPGRYVLIYISAKSSVLGISKPFEVKHFLSKVNNVAEEKPIQLASASGMKEKEL